MSEDTFAKAKKMEQDNKIAQYDRFPHRFEGITWADIVILVVSIILEIGGALALEYFFGILNYKMWIILGIILFTSIFGFFSFKYFKNKSHRRVRSKL
ncbi:MAG: hypothetical protein ACTSRE_15300 [Promethearchaeota archaeon]